MPPLRPEDLKANARYLAVPELRLSNPTLAQQYAADVHAAAERMGAPARSPMLAQQRAAVANEARRMLLQKYGGLVGAGIVPMVASPTPSPTLTPTPTSAPLLTPMVMPTPTPTPAPTSAAATAPGSGLHLRSEDMFNSLPPWLQSAARTLLAERFGLGPAADRE